MPKTRFVLPIFSSWLRTTYNLVSLLAKWSGAERKASSVSLPICAISKLLLEWLNGISLGSPALGTIWLKSVMVGANANATASAEPCGVGHGNCRWRLTRGPSQKTCDYTKLPNTPHRAIASARTRRMRQRARLRKGERETSSPGKITSCGKPTCPWATPCKLSAHPWFPLSSPWHRPWLRRIYRRRVPRLVCRQNRQRV